VDDPEVDRELGEVDRLADGVAIGVGDLVDGVAVGPASISTTVNASR
jgi:hypothetical protein